ncbi:NAD-P-binding protein [Coprinopsis sp. MPI-PUGE-AT-0042]|nr:NAD-P-binding protein [Coprinopsis sp. MPI-PUGE-AT-0042]
MSTVAAKPRVAVVTGAAGGMGRAIAIRLAKDGLSLVLTDLPSSAKPLTWLKAEIESAAQGSKVVVHCGDVSREEDVKSVVEDATSTLGGLDVMIANAGIALPGSVAETTAEDWDRMHNVNARGVFLCYKYAAIKMIEQGRGSNIIGASSIAGHRGWPMFSAYSATKFAVRGLTQAAAQELGAHKINVNAYAPGPIDTPMLAQVGEGSMGGRDIFYEKLSSSCALGRVGTPQDIASLVSFLASPDSRQVTGQTVSLHFIAITPTVLISRSQDHM